MDKTTEAKPQAVERLEMENRVGEHNGRFYTALGDGLIVEIEPGACRVIDETDLSLETDLQLPQVEPVLIGNPDPFRLFDFVSVAPKDKLLLMVYVILAFVPRIFKPLLYVTGPQGAGKSVLCSMLKMLIDPTRVVLSSVPDQSSDLDLLLLR